MRKNLKCLAKVAVGIALLTSPFPVYASDAGHSSLINCNIVNGGVILRNGKNRIANITIKNFTTALTLDTGNYESFINNIRLENEKNNANTIGIFVNCSDTTVSKVYGYGANTGIKIASGGDNYFKDVTTNTTTVKKEDNDFLSFLEKIFK